MAKPQYSNYVEGTDHVFVDPNGDGQIAVPVWQRRVVDRSLGEATRRSLHRGAELVFAAATLMEQRGGDSFTVQEIADTANQSLRTLYVHFDGKDDLLLAVVEEAMRAYARLVLEAIEVYDDPLERLAAAIYFATRFAERTTGGVILGMAKLRTRLIDSAPERLAAARVPVVGVFSRLVREAADAGELHFPKPDAAARMVMALVDSMGRSSALGESRPLSAPNIGDLVEFCIGGLGARLQDGWEVRFEQHWDSLPQQFSVAEHLQGGNGDSGIADGG